MRKTPPHFVAINQGAINQCDADIASQTLGLGDGPVEKKGDVYRLKKEPLDAYDGAPESAAERAIEAAGCDTGDEPQGEKHTADDKAKRDAWDVFFAHLAKKTNIDAALTASGMSIDAALYARVHDPEIALRWQQALAASYDELEMELLYRARFGTEKPVFYGGKRIETMREFDNSVALRLLNQHRLDHAARQLGKAPQDNAVDVLRERLLAYRRKVSGDEDATGSDDAPDKAH